jgi:hypothetical protein
MLKKKEASIRICSANTERTNPRWKRGHKRLKW